jgi:hypothetical protein
MIPVPLLLAGFAASFSVYARLGAPPPVSRPFAWCAISRCNHATETALLLLDDVSRLLLEPRH